MNNPELILMMGANAAPGEQDDVTVFSEGFRTSVNTPDFRELLTTWELYLPATSGVHIGTNSTWVSLDGMAQHCIDHIAIPLRWWKSCTHSQTLTEFDLANVHEGNGRLEGQTEGNGKLRETTEGFT